MHVSHAVRSEQDHCQQSVSTPQSLSVGQLGARTNQASRSASFNLVPGADTSLSDRRTTKAHLSDAIAANPLKSELSTSPALHLLTSEVAESMEVPGQCDRRPDQPTESWRIGREEPIHLHGEGGKSHAQVDDPRSRDVVLDGHASHCPGGDGTVRCGRGAAVPSEPTWGSRRTAPRGWHGGEVPEASRGRPGVQREADGSGDGRGLSRYSHPSGTRREGADHYRHEDGPDPHRSTTSHPAPSAGPPRPDPHPPHRDRYRRSLPGQPTRRRRWTHPEWK